MPGLIPSTSGLVLIVPQVLSSNHLYLYVYAWRIWMQQVIKSSSTKPTLSLSIISAKWAYASMFVGIIISD